MKAAYENDNNKAAGYGIFVVRDLAALDSVEGITFCLKRASDHKNLGSAGWQEAEIFQSPLAAEQNGDTVKLFIGPAVVDNLDMQETYRFSLLAPGKQAASCTMHTQDVRYSPMSGGQGIGMAPAAKPTPPPPPPVPEPVMEVDPEPKLQAVPTPMPSGPDKNKAPMLIGILVALLLAGGGAYYFLNKDKTAPPPVAEPAKVESPLSLARKHLSGAADPAASLAMSKDYRAKPDGADAAFLLVEDAAQKGNAKGMLELAGFYDPTDTNPAGSIAKDPRQAWNWYKKAEAAGEATAKDKLAALRAWAEAEAPKGSDAAKQILTLE